MALPTPVYPGAVWDGNEQSTANDPATPDPTVAAGRDYNETSAEVRAIETDLANAFDSESQPNMAGAIAALRSAIDSLAIHASQHKDGGSDEVAQSTPGVGAIPKAGGTGQLSTGWLPPATESAKGTVERATQAEVNAETDDERYVTSLKLGAWLNQLDLLEEDGAVDETQLTTTSTTFQDKLTFDTASLTGVYRISWMAIIGISSTSNAVEAQLYNVTDAVVVHRATHHTPGSTTDVVTQGGFCDVTFTGAPKQFKIQYRRVGVAGTASIENTRIALRRWTG